MPNEKEAMPKILPPTLRAKGRYIIFDIISETPIEYKDFVAALWNSLLNFIGELGTSETKLWIIKNLYDEKAQRGVLKCKHDMVEQIRAALALINMIGETRSLIRVIGVTGTLKSARNKYLGMRDLSAFRSA